MPNHSSKEPKRPRDVNQMAKFIVDLATGRAAPSLDPTSEATAQEETPSDSLRHAAKELGRRGGLKGGKARAANLTPEQRVEIAKKAAAARWNKDQS